MPTKTEPRAPSLSEQAYQEIRTRILDCDLEPGALISERGIAADLGLGIAAVRSALGRLSAEGLVTTLPRVGYQVANFTIEYINDFFEAWRVVGRAIIQLAIRRISDADRAVLRDMRERGEGARKGNRAAAIGTADEIFSYYIHVARNPLLGDFFNRMQADMHRLYTLVVRSGQGDSLADRMNTAPAFEDFATEEEALRYFEEFVDTSQWQIMSVVLGLPALSKVSLSFQ